MSASWPVVALGDVLSRRKEFIVIDDLQNYKRPRVQLHAQGIVLRDEVPGAFIKTKKQQVCRVGEFLVAEIDAKVGGFGLVPRSLDGAIVSSHYFLFVADEVQLDRRFLAWFVKTPGFRDQVEAQGSTNYAAIRPADVLDYRMPLPPLARQQRIVARIEELAGKVEEAQAFRQSAADECSALMIAETSRVLSRLTEFEMVPIRTLGAGCENPIQIGPFGAQLHRSDFVEDGVPVLNVGNVWPDGLRLDSLDHVTIEKAKQLARYTVKAGDLLFARSGATLGKVCIVPDECDDWLMTGHLFRVRFDPERVNNRYAFGAFRSYRELRAKVFGLVRGATRPGFNTTLLGSVELPVPPLAEQRRIVGYLDDVSAHVANLCTFHDRTRSELDALMPAVLDCAFKGDL